MEVNATRKSFNQSTNAGVYMSFGKLFCTFFALGASVVFAASGNVFPDPAMDQSQTAGVQKGGSCGLRSLSNCAETCRELVLLLIIGKGVR